MKKLIIMLVLCIPVALYAQKNVATPEPIKPVVVPSTAPGTDTFGKAWFLGVYPVGEKSIDNLVNAMLEVTAKGFMPVSLDLTPGYGFYVLYLKTADATPIPFSIVATTYEKLGKTMDELMKDKFRPKSVTIKGKTFLILSLKDANIQPDVVGSLLPSKPDIESLKNDIQSYAAAGFQPMSFTYDSKKMYVMFLKDKHAVGSKVEIASYKNDGVSLFAGVDYEIKRANRPWSLAIVDNQVWVMYIQ